MLINQCNRPKRILIVDDESTLVFFLKQDFLESDIPCQVDSASSGEEALTQLTYNQYDLLVTDLKMPGINGFTLVELARSMQGNIPIVLMTAFGSVEIESEAERLQVDSYLTKPFPTAQLKEIAYNIFMNKPEQLYKEARTNGQ